MIYLRAVLVGIAAMVLAVIAAYLMFVLWQKGRTDVGVDPVNLAKHPIIWLLLLSVFACGVTWALRGTWNK
jgi:hypothetical protein